METIARPRPASRRLYVLLAVAAGCSIFGFRYWTIFNFAVGLPLNDQWYSEYYHLYRPYVDGSFSLRGLFLPHNEHLLVLQKVAHLALFRLLGEWNVLFVLVFNGFIFATFCAVLVFLACRWLGEPTRILTLVVALVLMAGLPNALENYLLGFQTGWYFYFILSFLTCLSFYKSNEHPSLYYLGLLAAALSALCLRAGLLNLLLAIVPLGQEALAARRAGGGQLSPRFLAKVCSFLLVFIVLCTLVPGGPKALASGKAMIDGLAAGLSWPAPKWLFPLVQLPAVGILFAAGSYVVRGQRHPITLAGYFVVWSLAHVVTTAVVRGQIASRQMELLYFGILSALFGLLSSEAGSGGAFMHKLARVWLLLVYAGLLWQGALTWRWLGSWKHEWLMRYEEVYRYCYNHDRRELAGKTFERNNLVATLFGTSPTLLDDPKLEDLLPEFCSGRRGIQPAPDLALNESFRQTAAPPHSFVLWCRLASESNRPLEITNWRTPYLKLEVYGAMGSTAPELLDFDTRKIIRSDVTAAFGQPPGWRTIFVRTPGDHLKFQPRLEPGGWLICQVPKGCSIVQYYLEKVGRKAEFLFFFGAAGLLYCASRLLWPKRFVRLET